MNYHETVNMVKVGKANTEYRAALATEQMRPQESSAKISGHADTALREADELRAWAHAIAAKMETVLAPVLDAASPEEACAHGQPHTFLPPMFEQLQMHRNGLYEALRSIEKTLLRVNL